MDGASGRVDPGPILQTAFAFWSSKVLLTAVDFGVFTKLGKRKVTGVELGKELGMHSRGVDDFFDALVAMKFLEREGDGPDAKYFNTPAGTIYLDSSSPRYVGGILAMLNARLFKFWHDLPEALRSGKPQNEIKHSQKGVFEELYSEQPRLELFLGSMTGLSRINFEAVRPGKHVAHRLDSVSVLLTVCDKTREVMIKSTVDDAVRHGCSGAEAFQVFKTPSMRFGSGGNERLGARIRPRQSEYLMARFD